MNTALVQFKPRKGDIAANLRAMREVFAQLASGGDDAPDLVVLPEAALTGYFLEGAVYELAMTAQTVARHIDEQWRAAGASRTSHACDVVLGFFENANGTFHNSAIYVRCGEPDGPRIVHVHRKMFLPTYGVFDEERFLTRGRRLSAFDTAFGRAAMLVCEDAWHAIMPTVAALKGARLLIVPSASPGRGLCGGDDELESNARWKALLGAAAAEHGVYVVYAGLTGFEGGKGMSGGTCAFSPRGELLATAPPLGTCIVRVRLDAEEVDLARATIPLLGDLSAVLPDLWLDDELPVAHRLEGAAPVNAQTAGARWPVIAAQRAEPSLAIDPELTARWLEAFLRDEMLERRGIGRAIIGLSGGIDSAVVAYLCARALGPQNVFAIRMPYRASSASSLSDAQRVIDALGIHAETIEISDAVDAYLNAAPDADARRRGNVMARMRMLVLFDQSARREALPVGTGNKTERLMGYFTWHADDTPPVNPIGDLFKTQVWDLARHLGVPVEIIDKPPSADLEANQTDEGDLGITYVKADRILNMILLGYRDDAIAARGFAPAEIRLVRRRVDGTHWKRHLPTSALVSGTAINEFYLRPVDL